MDENKAKLMKAHNLVDAKSAKQAVLVEIN